MLWHPQNVKEKVLGTSSILTGEKFDAIEKFNANHEKIFMSLIFHDLSFDK